LIVLYVFLNRRGVHIGKISADGIWRGKILNRVKVKETEERKKENGKQNDKKYSENITCRGRG
jgi:hypothetical protein